MALIKEVTLQIKLKVKGLENSKRIKFIFFICKLLKVPVEVDCEVVNGVMSRVRTNAN